MGIYWKSQEIISRSSDCPTRCESVEPNETFQLFRYAEKRSLCDGHRRRENTYYTEIAGRSDGMHEKGVVSQGKYHTFFMLKKPVRDNRKQIGKETAANS